MGGGCGARPSSSARGGCSLEAGGWHRPSSALRASAQGGYSLEAGSWRLGAPVVLVTASTGGGCSLEAGTAVIHPSWPPLGEAAPWRLEAVTAHHSSQGVHSLRLLAGGWRVAPPVIPLRASAWGGYSLEAGGWHHLSYPSGQPLGEAASWGLEAGTACHPPSRPPLGEAPPWRLET